MKYRSSLLSVLPMLLVASHFSVTQTKANAPIQVTPGLTADGFDATNGNDARCEVTVGQNDCTLRAAIQTANGLPGDDVIILPAGTYELSPSGTTAPMSAFAVDSKTGDLDIGGNLVIQGADAATTIIKGAAGYNDRIFDIAGASVTDGITISVSITGVTIANGVVTGDSGGGISNDANLTLDNTIVTNNKSILQTVPTVKGGDGAGIRNRGTLTVMNSTLSNNEAGDDGGAIVNSAGTVNLKNVTLSNNKAAGSGGAIATSGTVTAQATTFTDNTATSATSDGGAILNNGTLNLTNVTLFRNSAQRNGGAIASTLVTGGATPKVSLINNTIAYNNSVGNGENIRSQSGELTLRNTMLVIDAASAGRNCSIDNTVVVSSNNLESTNFAGIGSTTSCGLSAQFNDRINVADAGLDTTGLKNNGGTTQTIALREGSPAIDAGDNNGCPNADQRGSYRPFDGNGDGAPVCDIGAYEFGASVLNFKVYLPLVLNTK